jgi:hypothetical protein
MKEKAKGKTAKFWVASRHLTSSRRHIVQTRAPEVPEIRGSSIVMCQKSANLTVSQIPECHVMWCTRTLRVLRGCCLRPGIRWCDRQSTCVVSSHPSPPSLPSPSYFPLSTCSSTQTNNRIECKLKICTIASSTIRHYFLNRVIGPANEMLHAVAAETLHDLSVIIHLSIIHHHHKIKEDILHTHTHTHTQPNRHNTHSRTTHTGAGYLRKRSLRAQSKTAVGESG